MLPVNSGQPHLRISDVGSQILDLKCKTTSLILLSKNSAKVANRRPKGGVGNFDRPFFNIFASICLAKD